MHSSAPIVECNASTLPGAIPAITPRGPSVTSRTAAPSVTQIPTTSLARPSSTGSAANEAAPENGSSDSARRAHSVVGTPSSTSRCAMPAP